MIKEIIWADKKKTGLLSAKLHSYSVLQLDDTIHTTFMPL